MTIPPKGKGKLPRYQLHTLLDASFRAMRLTVPVTEAEVRQAEEEIAGQDFQLPQRLADPFRILNEETGSGSTPAPVVAAEDDTIVEELARAAREGSLISPLVEAAMQRDREAAEGEALGDGE